MPQPQRHAFTFVDDGTHYEAFCVPPALGGRTLKDLYPEHRGSDQYRLAMEAVSGEFRRRRTTTVFIPAVSYMSGAVAGADELDQELRGPWNLVVRRRRDLRADGVPVLPGQGFAMSTAGCALVVASGGGIVLAAHAGFGSIVDLGWMARAEPRRHPHGILHAMATRFHRAGVRSQDVTLRMFFAIHPDCFIYPLDHPERGEGNRRLYRFLSRFAPGGMDGLGRIDLAVIGNAYAERLCFKRFESYAPLTDRDGFAVSAAAPARNLVGLAVPHYG